MEHRPVLRREDRRFLTGSGRFVADTAPPQALHVAFVRSPHAHARIVSIDATAALAVPGVVAVFTGHDLGLPPLPSRYMLGAACEALQPVLPTDVVRFVGEAVAVVVAEDRYTAEDGVEAVDVTYDPLPTLVDPVAAMAPDAPQLHPVAPGNVAHVVTHRKGDAAAALAGAHRVLTLHLEQDRGCAMPLETRGCTATYNPDTGRLTVCASTQTPWVNRDLLARLLGLPKEQVHYQVPDIGGGFGMKSEMIPEEAAVAWVARRFGASGDSGGGPMAPGPSGGPVTICWQQDRHEHITSQGNERRQVHDVEVAVDAAGQVLGIRHRFIVDIGCAIMKMVVPFNLANCVMGPYRIPAYHLDGHVVYTNKPPMGAVRGAGRPTGAFVIERVMDAIARELGFGRDEVRRRNLIQPDQLPYDTGLINRAGKPVVYDSGNYPELLRLALAAADFAGFPAEQAAARGAGRYLGMGIACTVEETAVGPQETVALRLDETGQVTVLAANAPQGQGHETALAHLAATELGLPPERVQVRFGDTDDPLAPSIGTFASRTAVMQGNAVKLAADDLKARLAALARQAGGIIEGRATFAHPGTNWSSGTQVVVVEVDPETGAVQLLRAYMAHDCGRVLNPLLVAGQVQGGFAHGVGNALLERIPYDDAGQPLMGSLLDYLLPTALDVPSLHAVHIETPSTTNPLGLKGAGESGTIPTTAAVAQAVEDALAPWGVTVTSTPIDPTALAAAVRSHADIPILRR